jgi:hypothetical protein
MEQQPKSLTSKGCWQLWSTQFEANVALHIILKVATRKISLTLNNFKDRM